MLARLSAPPSSNRHSGRVFYPAVQGTYQLCMVGDRATFLQSEADYYFACARLLYVSSALYLYHLRAMAETPRMRR